MNERSGYGLSEDDKIVLIRQLDKIKFMDNNYVISDIESESTLGVVIVSYKIEKTFSYISKNG